MLETLNHFYSVHPGPAIREKAGLFFYEYIIDHFAKSHEMDGTVTPP